MIRRLTKVPAGLVSAETSLPGFRTTGLVRSPFPDRGLNPGRGSESAES